MQTSKNSSLWGTPLRKVTLEGKELELYAITPEGLLEWRRIRSWLCKLLDCDDDACER